MNLPIDDEGERGENKIVVNIFLYAVYLIEIFFIQIITRRFHRSSSMPMMEQKELLNLAQTPTSEFWIFLADFNQ